MSAITPDEIYDRRTIRTPGFRPETKGTPLGARRQILGVAALAIAISALALLAAFAAQTYATQDDPGAPPAFTAVGP
jgi:hypothetical protein